MALQTSVLRHGEWVTETIDLQAVLKGNSSPAAKPPQERVARLPGCGILTKTAIESPVAHWILPARLRSSQHMDVAIVGDHYVQVSEMCENGQLRDIVRKTDFGSRIRNAKVIGSIPEKGKDFEEKEDDDVVIKTEKDPFDLDDSDGDDLDVAMDGTNAHRPTASSGGSLARLPPQQLLVVLESGDCVFLFVRTGIADRYEFVTTRYESLGKRIIQPGFHAAVDPSSRYVALGCTEGLFVVHELESSQELSRSYARNEPLRFIKSSRPRAVQGVIHKMEFLFPRPEDDYHIILLLIVVRNDKSRMVTYEWEAGDSLAEVLAEEKRGQPLPPQHQMPLLIVPLTVHSAFFAISASRIGVCRDALDLPVEFDDFLMEVHETSRFHHGLGEPLWAAWTRPYRLATYNTTRDNIYLAREDGVVMFLDIDSENILGASVEIGKFDCNIGTSFCSLFDKFSDILIMGGDSGPSTIWKIGPRQPNIQLGTIPNWSPVADFVTSDEFAYSNRLVGTKENKLVPWKDRLPGTYTKPDRIFATSGRGVTGAITEFRYGLRANIGLDIDFETPVKQSWIFPIQSDDASLGFHLLVSFVDRSAAFHLSRDLAQASELESEAAPYDLASQTVAAAQLPGGVVVQVTEHSLVIHSRDRSLRHRHADLFHEPQMIAADACIQDTLVAVSAHVGSLFWIHLLQIGNDGLVRVISSSQQTEDTIPVVFGTRGGDVVTLVLNRSGKPVVMNFDKVGLTATHVALIDDNTTTKKSPLVVCDGRVSLLADFDARRALFRSMHMVWVVDAADFSKASPLISAVSVLPEALPGNHGKTQLLFSARSRVMLAELHPQPGPVHRSLPVGGTPTKVIYSHILNCLIVALRDLEDRTTLNFLDPDTGDNLSAPTDKSDNPVEFVSGLGRVGDQIYGLSEWRYEREGDEWAYLLVATKEGRLLVLSAQATEVGGTGGQRPKIRYWTRYKRSRFSEPVYSVVGWNSNLFYCVGTTVYWDQLDLTEKKLKLQGTYGLNSFATSLRIVNRKVVALKDRESFEIIDIAGGSAGDMFSHHSDPESRSAADMIEVGAGGAADGELGPQILLVCDQSCGVAGLWVPWQQPGRDCTVLFEADLPASVRRLARGRTRPCWQQARRDVRYGLLPSTADAAEILGVCIDGSVQHFTLLSMPIWRVLRLVQNLALVSPTLYPFTFEHAEADFDAEPEADRRAGMQVDGDMLQRCLDKRALEELFVERAHAARLATFLDKLDDGQWTTGFRKHAHNAEGGEEGRKDDDNNAEDDEEEEEGALSEETKSKYLALLYDILEYFLAPVM
ncbi:thermotolerance protein [Niveomyces insectorum RCEF 264]|uniref:Thermotolerance protein n=1 Tax=Niveomyces insectorum RCEF 264 TaxID=1081102 RepID=A0A162IBK1_9HYPO|nr:thermotolerance protein [Niveomyces insectorum RCEF 264]